MGASTSPERPSTLVGETVPHKISLKGKLDSGELATGTPTVTEVTTSDLTISGIALNTSTITVSGDTSVLASQGVACLIAGQLAANSPYTLLTTFTTDAGATRKGYSIFVVGAD